MNRIRGLLAEFESFCPETRRPSGSTSTTSWRMPVTTSPVWPAWCCKEPRNIGANSKHIQWCDERIAAHQKDDEQVQRAAELKGVGPITASAMVATVGDFKQFKNGAQFGAWLGLTPKQNSSGGKSSLGGITKRGKLLLAQPADTGSQGCCVIGKHNDDPISQWAQRLRERCGWQKSRCGARQQERSNSLGRRDPRTNVMTPIMSASHLLERCRRERNRSGRQRPPRSLFPCQT